MAQLRAPTLLMGSQGLSAWPLAPSTRPCAGVPRPSLAAQPASLCSRLPAGPRALLHGTCGFRSRSARLARGEKGASLGSISPARGRLTVRAERQPGAEKSAAERQAPSGREREGGQLARRAAGSNSDSEAGSPAASPAGFRWGDLRLPRAVGQGVAVAALAGALVLLQPAGSALGADALATCKCLLENCRGELLRCLGDVNCAANIACLQSCNGRADEVECQIACTDLFADPVVDRFNACAISEHPCVPQKADENRYPAAPDSALVPELDLQKLKGPWYISAGQNPAFDTFDCQLHTFMPVSPSRVEAEITWRIRTPDGGFFTRRAIQKFNQVDGKPGLLLNHEDNILNYKDDWFILGTKLEGADDDYFLVYYRGTNDAWDGYGGATLYTRSATVPQSIVPQVKAQLQPVNLEFDRFIVTDNTCPAPRPLLARLEKTLEDDVVLLEKAVEDEVVLLEKAVEDEVVMLENKVLEVAKEELKLLANLGKGLEELKKDKDSFLKRVTGDDKELLEQMEALKMGGADDLEDLFGNSIPLRRVR